MPVSDDLTLGQWMRYARAIKPSSQADVAARLGVSPGVISRWENDLSVPREAQLRSIEEFLGETAPERLQEALSIRNRLPQFLVITSGSLSPRERRIVMRAYESAIESVGEAEIAYVDDKCLSKLSSIKSSRTSWVRNLSELAEALFVLYSDCRDEKVSLPDEAFRRIVAALCYFVDPADVIPDTTLGTGYLDDVIVINECARYLATACPHYAAEYLPLAQTGREKRGS